MHIEVNQSLQKIAANLTRKIFPQEIDWLLNKNMERYIQTKVKPKKDGTGGFQIDELDADAIRPLIKTRIPVTAFRYDTSSFASVLPGDYSYLLADASEIKRTCGDDVDQETITESLLVIPIKKSNIATGPNYYENVILTLNGSVEFNATDFALARGVSYTGFASEEEIFELVTPMLLELKRKGFNVYFEKYGNKFFPRSIIVVSTGSITGSISIDSVVTSGVLSSFSYKIESTDHDPVEYPNRLSPSTKIPTLNATAFYKTVAESPLSELEGSLLKVHANETFIVSKSLLSYVRKPNRISIILGQDCELAAEFHQAICDLTVEYIKGMIADPNWEVKLKDNMVRTFL